MSKSSRNQNKNVSKIDQKIDPIKNNSQVSKFFSLCQITQDQPPRKHKISLPLYKISSLKLPYEGIEKSKISNSKQNKKSDSQISKSTVSISKQIFTTTIQSARQHYLNPNKKKPKKTSKKNSNLKQKKSQLIYPTHLIETLFSALNSKINTEQNQYIPYQKCSRVTTQQDQPILLLKQHAEFVTASNPQSKDQSNNLSLDFYAKKIQRFWRSYRTKKLIRSYMTCNGIKNIQDKINNFPIMKSQNKIKSKFDQKYKFFNSCEQTKDTFKPDILNYFQESQKSKRFQQFFDHNSKLIVQQNDDISIIPKTQLLQTNQIIYLKPQQIDQLLDYQDRDSRTMLFRQNSQSSDIDYKIPTFMQNKSQQDIETIQNLQKMSSELTKLKFDEIENIIQKNSQILQNQFQTQIDLLKNKLSEQQITMDQFEIEYKKCAKWLSMKSNDLEKYYKQLHKIAGETKLIIKQLNEFQFFPDVGLSGSISDPIISYLHNSEQHSFCEMNSINSLNIEEKSLHQKLQQITLKIQSQYKEQFYQQIIQQIWNNLFKEILEDIKSSEFITSNLTKIMNNKKYKKAKGIRTDQMVIDSFIKKIIQFAYTKNKNSFHRLNQSIGPSSFQILKYEQPHNSIIQQNQSVEQINDNRSVISFTVFQQFESLVLGMMSFEKEFQNLEIQNQRIKFIKSIINFHNEAIFDALNQSLNFQRRYGILGQSFLWNSKKTFLKGQINLEDALQNARCRLLRYQSYHCGQSTDKPLKLLEYNEKLQILYVKQNKIIKMIDEVMHEQSYGWLRFDLEQTLIKLNIARAIEYALINQVITQLNEIKK